MKGVSQGVFIEIGLFKTPTLSKTKGIALLGATIGGEPHSTEPPRTPHPQWSRSVSGEDQKGRACLSAMLALSTSLESKYLCQFLNHILKYFYLIVFSQKNTQGEKWVVKAHSVAKLIPPQSWCQVLPRPCPRPCLPACLLGPMHNHSQSPTSPVCAVVSVPPMSLQNQSLNFCANSRMKSDLHPVIYTHFN